MTELTKYIVGGLIAVLLLLLSFCAGKSSKPDAEVRTIVQKDTAWLVKESKPLVLEKVKTKIVYLNDTIYQTAGFAAVVDTVIQKDTVFARFEYPAATLDLLIRRKPDSTLIQTITITKEITKPRPWWESAAYVGGGVALGFLLGGIK